MGFNSVALFLNDRLDEIKNDPYMGEKLVTAILSNGYRRPTMPYLPGGGQILSVHHADTMAVIAAGGNTGRVIGYGSWNQTDDELIRWLERKRRAEARALKAKGT